MKLRNVCAVAVAIVASALMSVCAQAATYSAGAVNGETGSEVQIPVYAKAESTSDTINGFIVRLTYDPSFATPVVKGKDASEADTYATAGKALENGVLVSGIVNNADDSTKKDLIIGWAAADAVDVTASADEAAGLLELVDASFTIAEGATGTSAVDVTVTSVAKNSTDTPVAGTVEADGNGSITVAKGTVLLGDVNNDSYVDVTDITLLTQYVNSVISDLESEYPGANERANVNKDSAIDVTDITLLTQYVNNVITSFE